MLADEMSHFYLKAEHYQPLATRSVKAKAYMRKPLLHQQDDLGGIHSTNIRGTANGLVHQLGYSGGVLGE